MQFSAASVVSTVLPIARWPQRDGTYPEGPGPEVRTQSQLAQQVALGLTLLVIPASSRAWQWPQHAAIPVTDAPSITTVLAWPPHLRSPALDALRATAAALPPGDSADPLPPPARTVGET